MTAARESAASSGAAVMAEQCTGRGARAVVLAAAPLAAQAAAAAIRDGGNAFDAAVAAALAETVLLPSKCGLGGDLVAIAVTPGDTAPVALLAVGGAPAGLAAVAAAGAWSDTGPNAVGAPAAAAGYSALAERARLPLPRLAAPAIALARDGFPWAAVNERLAHASVDLLRRWNPGGTTYLPDDRPIGAGTIVRLPRLAAAVESFAQLGASFLDGPVGRAIVDTVQACGGVLTVDDLAGATAEWVACAEGRLDGRPVWATPAPTHGRSLLSAVAGARPGDSPGVQYRRSMTAIAARRAELADPSGTSIVSAADAEGNAVVVIHSNSYPRYGSGLVVSDYDLVLANRAGRGFSPEPGHPNFPEPGRRPATTLHAWALGGADGRPVLLGGTPGGDNQMTWNVQLLQNALDGLSPGAMVVAPRWEWLPADDGVRIEDGFSPDERDELRGIAPRAVDTGRWGLPCAQQVIEVPVPGATDRAITGAADPRTVGAALGV